MAVCSDSDLTSPARASPSHFALGLAVSVTLLLCPNRSDFEGILVRLGAYAALPEKYDVKLTLPTLSSKTKGHLRFMLFASKIKHQIVDDHTRSVHFFLQRLRRFRRLLLVLTFLGGCWRANVRTCLWRPKPGICLLLGQFYFYAAMFCAAGRACVSRWSCILCWEFLDHILGPRHRPSSNRMHMFGSSAFILSKETQHLLEGFLVLGR